MSPEANPLPAAIALIKEERIDEAETLLRQTPALPPEGMILLGRLLHNRAITAVQRQDWSAAESLLKEALGIVPGQTESRRNLAELLLNRVVNAVQNDNLPGAAQLTAAAAGWWPEIGPALGERIAPLAAHLHDTAVKLASSQPVTSARLALAAWALTPDKAEYYATCRSIVIHLGTGELGAKVEASTFEEILQADPNDVVSLLGLANLHRSEARLNKAEALCRQALAQPVGQAFAAGRLASVLAEQCRFGEADALYRLLDRPEAGIERNIRLDPSFMAGLEPLAQRFASAWRDGPPDSELPPDRELVVFASCDSRYFAKYIDAFANSTAKACTQAILHVHVVDPTADTEIQAADIRRRHPGLPFILTSEASPADLDDKTRRVYFACARFLRLPELLEHYRRPVLMLDIDSVILRDISPLLAQAKLELADLALVFGIPREPWSRLWADILLAAPTAKSLAFLDQTARYIAHFFRRGTAAWFLDQVALYATHACGLTDQPRPKILEWPMDIQNSGLEHTYFWSLHVSQPNNSGNETMDLYLSIKQG